MNLKIEHLQTLREVIRRGSFSQAAKSRHLTQPAVSLQIRELEAQVGEALVERVGKRAFPTPAAKVLLPYATRIVAELDNARQALQKRQGIVAGQVRIGSGNTASIYLLPPVLRTLKLQFPHLELRLTTGNDDHIIQSVLQNELEMGVVTLPVPKQQLHIEPLWPDPLVAIAPPDLEMTSKRLTPAMMSREPLILFEPGGHIRSVIDQWFLRDSVTPRIIMELDSSEVVKQLVGAGLGMSIVPAITTEQEVQSGTLIRGHLRPALSRRLGLIYRRDKPMTPAFEAVLNAVRASV